MLKLIVIVIVSFVFTAAYAASQEDLSTVKRISAAEAYAKYKKGDAIFVDAMGPHAYAKKHIVGSINMPNDGPQDIQALRDMTIPFALDQEFVVYCQ